MQNGMETAVAHVLVDDEACFGSGVKTSTQELDYVWTVETTASKGLKVS